MSDAPARILVVDDEPSITEFVGYALRKEGFSVDVVDNGEDALSRAMKNDYDLFVLDIMLPGIDGYELCRRLRTHTSSPVLFLSARDSELDKVVGLEIGGDDYLSKPFDLDIFQARLDALVRRTRRDESAQREGLRFLELTLWTNTRTARIGDGKLDLHGKQFDFLYYLVENKNVIVHKERLFQRVWGFYSATDFSVVEVYASQIRKLLRQYDYEKYLKTVRGIGYILTDDSELYG